MKKCGTCKYWKRTGRLGECQYNYLVYPDLPGKPVVLYSGPNHKVSRFSVGELFGCVYWEEISGPFYLTSWHHTSGISWGVNWANKSAGPEQVIACRQDESEAREVCRTLNRLWARRDD